MADNDQQMDIVRMALSNAGALQRYQLTIAEERFKAPFSINRANTAFVHLMEMNAVTTAGLMQDAVAQLSLIYPSLATDEEALYRHMSGKDYLGRFSMPSHFGFLLSLPVYEVQNNAVDTQDGSGTRKLTIPRHSSITVSDTTFTLQYPIDIFVYSHGAIEVAWDVSQPSPIESQEMSRIITAGRWVNEGVELLGIPIDIKQFAIDSQSTTISGVAGFRETYTFKDLFFYCRCYSMLEGQDRWTEIFTTHSDVTYDPTKPTVCLKVDTLNKTLTAEIPQIYITSGLLRDQIRIDIYTTKGKLEMSLENFQGKSYKANYVDRDLTAATDPLGFNSRMGLFSSVGFAALTEVSGGADPITFGEIRNRVIHRNSFTEGLPITEAQVANKLKEIGFSNTTVVDNIGNRQFLANRRLPNPSNGSTVSGMGSIVQLQITNLERLSKLPTTVDNGERITVLPNTVYDIQDGVLNILDHEYVLRLLDKSRTPPDMLANLINQSNYYFTPFFYVHDVSGNQYELRAYRLDNVVVESKHAVLSNQTLGLNVGVTNVDAKLMPDYSGFRFVYTIKGSDLLKELPLDKLKLQLSYLDPASGFRTIFNGTLISPIDDKTGRPLNDEWIYEVVVGTNWDIDKEHRIRVGSGSSMAPLNAEWDVIVFIQNHYPLGAVDTVLEERYDPTLLPDYDFTAKYTGVMQESHRNNLGSHLDKLWARSNSVIEEWMYKRYQVDIPAIWEEDQYKHDGTNYVMELSPDRKKMIFVVEHRAGDPILDPQGRPTYWHRKNEVMVDENKKPIITDGERGILRHVDLVLLDGKYFFATADTTLEYVATVKRTLETWNNVTLEPIKQQLINQTFIKYHPTATVGLIKVIVGDNQMITLEADQQITIDFTVSDYVFKNTILRASITKASIEVVEEYFKSNRTFSRSKLVEAISARIGNDVIGIKVTGMFGDRFDTVSLAYESIGPAIGKRLVTDTTLAVSVEDSIDVNFLKHRVKVIDRQ